MTANQFTNLVYVVSRCGNVSVIDGKTITVKNTINVDSSPWSVSINSSTDRAYVTKQHNNSVVVYNTLSVINGTTNSILNPYNTAALTATVNIHNGQHNYDKALKICKNVLTANFIRNIDPTRKCDQLLS